MDKFDERLYELLGEYFPDCQNKKISGKAKERYIYLLGKYLNGASVECGWYLSIRDSMITRGCNEYFAHALATIRDDWKLEELEEEENNA